MPESSSKKPSSDKPGSQFEGSRSESSNLPTSPRSCPNATHPTSPEIGRNPAYGQLPESSEKWVPSRGESPHAVEDPFSQWYSTSTQFPRTESQESTVRGAPSQRGGRAAAARRGALMARIAAWTPEQRKAYCLNKWGRETHPMADGVDWDGREDIAWESGLWDPSMEDVEGGPGATLDSNFRKTRWRSDTTKSKF